MDQNATWYGGRPPPWPHCVRWGPSSPKGAQQPQFSTHVYCGQKAGWIKIPLGTEVGLGPVLIVLGGDPAPLRKKGAESPNFRPCLLWPKGWMDQDATWYGGRPRPRRHSVRWGPSLLIPKKAQLPIFGPCLLWPNGCMYQGTTWNVCRPRHRGYCVRWGPSSPSPKSPPAIFGQCPLRPNGWMD